MKRKRVPPNMAAQVLLTFGSDCWLDMPGCTHRGTETMDHVKPYSLYGPTVPSNLRPACKHCNSLRADRVVSGFGAQVTAVIGPPCVGKTAYVRDHMAPGDIVVDPSRLAVACVDGGSEAHALADTLWAARTGVCPAWSRPGMCGWCVRCRRPATVRTCWPSGSR